MQLKFNFDGLSETDMLWAELEATEKKLGNLRRGLFARHTILQKRMDAMEEQMNAMKPKRCEIEQLPLFALEA